VTDIAKSVGTSRILRGFAITCPVGNPNLNEADEKAYRRHYAEKALEMLKEPGRRDQIANLA